MEERPAINIPQGFVRREWDGYGIGTGLLSTLMESGMDMRSCMVVLVMCVGKRTGYGMNCSVTSAPTPLAARG